jgi:hypothetical protein
LLDVKLCLDVHPNLSCLYQLSDCRLELATTVSNRALALNELCTQAVNNDHVALQLFRQLQQSVSTAVSKART